MNLPYKYLLVTLVTGFVLGAACGIAGDRCMRGRWMRQPPPKQPIEWLARELQLTSEQKTQVDAIMKSKREKMDAIRMETREELRKTLTPDQLKRFETLREKRRRSKRRSW